MTDREGDDEVWIPLRLVDGNVLIDARFIRTTFGPKKDTRTDDGAGTYRYRVTKTGDVLVARTTEQPAPFDPTLRIE